MRKLTPYQWAKERHKQLQKGCRMCNKSERIDGVLYCIVSEKMILPRYETIQVCRGRRLQCN